jgi:hypothetical protein
MKRMQQWGGREGEVSGLGVAAGFTAGGVFHIRHEEIEYTT